MNRSTQDFVDTLSSKLDHADLCGVPATNPSVVRCRFLLDLARDGVVSVGPGSPSSIVYDTIDGLTEVINRRDPLLLRQAIRSAGRTYAQDAAGRRPDVAPARRVFSTLPSPAGPECFGGEDYPSEPADGAHPL